MRLEPGQVALRRYFKRGNTVSVVKYARVVGDDDRGLLLWVPGGSPLRWLKAADGRGLHEIPFADGSR